MITLGVIDYRSGNLFNLVKALKYVGSINCEIVTDANMAERFDKLVLPGVGSFREGMQNIVRFGFDSVIRRHLESGKAMLGICAGMQLLARCSEEFGMTAGLGLVDGEVVSLRRIEPVQDFLVPNIGWRSVLKTGCADIANQPRPASILFSGVEPDDLFYFAHSYALASIPENLLSWTTSFGSAKFISAFEKDNMFGVQFHPELSGSNGLTLLKNFLLI